MASTVGTVQRKRPEKQMLRRQLSKLEIEWPGGSLRAVGVPALVLSGALAIACLTVVGAAQRSEGALDATVRALAPPVSEPIDTCFVQRYA